MDFQRIKPHLPWITLVVLVACVGVVDDTFLRPANLLAIAGDIVPLFIMALGLTFAIYIGGIDLSAQSMANLVTVIASLYLASLGAWVAVLCVAVGFGLGMLSGYVTTKAGERLAFSILMNHYDREGGASTARALQDALVLTLLDVPRRR